MGIGHIITDQGKQIILDRTFAAGTFSAPLRFRTGTGTTTPIASQTALVTPVTAAATFLTGYPIVPPSVSLNLVMIRAFLDTTQANGNSLTEFGIFNTDGTPKMFSRTVHNPITKTSSVQVLYAEK